MPIRVKCPNPECGRVFSLKDELGGKKVRCSRCGSSIPVPAASSPEATLGEPGVSSPEATALEPEQESALPRYHPARLVCTNCGAVLGVRDKICSQCGGDVRSGVTVMRISREEREKAGLFASLPWMKKKGKKGGAAGWLILAGIVIAVVAVVIIFVLR